MIYAEMALFSHHVVAPKPHSDWSCGAVVLLDDDDDAVVSSGACSSPRTDVPVQTLRAMTESSPSSWCSIAIVATTDEQWIVCFWRG